MDSAEELWVEAALEAERQFVFTLGGFALELAGAALVTHEKLPVPRFGMRPVLVLSSGFGEDAFATKPLIKAFCIV